MAKMYNRIFCFGCSFTQYVWPTWPQYLSAEYPDSTVYNLGWSGTGNVQIFNSLTHAIHKYNIGQGDLVVVLCSTTQRIDAMEMVYSLEGLKYEYNGAGDFRASFDADTRKITQPQKYSIDFLSQTYIPEWIYMQSVNSIQAIVSYMRLLNADFKLASIEGIDYPHEHNSIIRDIYDVHGNLIKLLHENSVLQKVFNNTYDELQQKCSALHKHYSDIHPMPVDQIDILEKVFRLPLSKSTIDLAHQHESIIYDIVRNCDPDMDDLCDFNREIDQKLTDLLPRPNNYYYDPLDHFLYKPKD